MNNMDQYISKSALAEEIKRRKKEAESNCGGYKSGDEHRCDDCTVGFYEEFLEILDTLEVIKDPYEQWVQYDSIKAGIQAHAEDYSFNIESMLFPQLTKEQQKLWRKEIEQACISGGDAGYLLARDSRYKENLEVKEIDLVKDEDYINDLIGYLQQNNKLRNTKADIIDWLKSLKVKEVDLEKEFDKYCENYTFDDECEVYTAKHFFELGLRAQERR